MRPLARRPRHPTASFTLVEILVALAIFSVVLVILGSMLTFAGSIYKDGHGRVENFTKSRAMLDLIAGDLQNGVFRPDLPAFGTGSQYGTTNGMTALFNAGPTNAFYTRRAGVGANVRPLSLVVYSLTATTATLQRSDYAVPWTPATDWSGYLPFGASLDAPLTQATARDVAEGVVDFELVFRRQDGSVTNVYNGFNPTNAVVAVGIGLAVVDTPTLQTLSSANLTSINAKLAATFVQSLQTTTGVKAAWDASLTSSFFSAYPHTLSSDLQTFERWVPSQPPF